MAKRILCVDDSPTVRAMVSAWLTRAGYDVVVCVNGSEAAERATREKPDLVVSDVNMPIMDGFGLCRQLKGSPETAHIPVLLLTKLSDAHDVVQGLDSGADGFLVKGIAEQELLGRIDRLLRENNKESLRTRRSAVDSLSEKLRLTDGRASIFKLLFEALAREVAFDILVLLVADPDTERSFVCISRGPLPDELRGALIAQMGDAFGLLGGKVDTVGKPKMQELTVTDAAVPAFSAGTKPHSSLKVPLLDGARLCGLLGVFAMQPNAVFDENIRFFFEIGNESTRALRRLSIDA